MYIAEPVSERRTRRCIIRWDRIIRDRVIKENVPKTAESGRNWPKMGRGVSLGIFYGPPNVDMADSDFALDQGGVGLPT